MSDRTSKWQEVSRQYFIDENGRFIGDFEAMYAEFENPWLQDEAVVNSPHRLLSAFRISQMEDRSVLDISCGNGSSTEMLRIRGQAEVLGIDVATSAIEIARTRFPECRFETGDVEHLVAFQDFRPTAITMFGLTWCILDKFVDTLESICSLFSGATVFHTLAFYPPGVQKYGVDFFSNLDELVPYFSDLYIIETVTHATVPFDGAHTTLVVARVP